METQYIKNIIDLTDPQKRLVAAFVNVECSVGPMVEARTAGDVGVDHFLEHATEWLNSHGVDTPAQVILAETVQQIRAAM